MLAIKQDEIEQKIIQAERCNRFLLNLTRSYFQIEASITPNFVRRNSAYYQTVRAQATKLEALLHSKFLKGGCDCGVLHNASLKIEVQQPRKMTRRLCFNVVFSFQTAPLGPEPP